MLAWLRTSWKGRARPDERAGTAAAAADPALAAEFEARGPWLTRFWVGGVPYGGPHDLTRDPRLGMAERALGGWAGRRVLELGALEGGHSLSLAARGASVVALEARAANLERARWAAGRLGVGGVTFHQADVRTADLEAWGRFDVILASGLLYHLEAPWDLLARLGPVAPLLFVWTHYAREADGRASVQVQGETLSGHWRREYGLADPLSGLGERSFWPTRASLERMLALTGWAVVEAQADPEHRDGPAVTLLARRAAGS